jgi:hypothetical protein
VKLVIVSVLAGAVLAAAPATPRKQTLIGIVSDDMCALAGHASMRMGPTDAECTVACVDAHGAQYVLVVGKDVYTFVDQQQPQKFAGQKVRATGTVEIVKGVKNFRADSVTGIK